MAAVQLHIIGLECIAGEKYWFLHSTWLFCMSKECCWRAYWRITV